MAPNPKIKRACNAMKPFGIQEAKVKSVLKKLLKIYDNKWDFIQEENYQVLLNAILEEETDSEATEKQKNEEEKRESKDVATSSGKKKAPPKSAVKDEDDDVEEDEVPLRKRLRPKCDRGCDNNVLSISSPMSLTPKHTLPREEEEDDDDMTELPPLKRYLRRSSERESAITVANNASPSSFNNVMELEEAETEKDSDESGAIILVEEKPFIDHMHMICSSPSLEMENSEMFVEENDRKTKDTLCDITAIVVSEQKDVVSELDITFGEEIIEIPWVNDINNEVPQRFRYIAQSYVSQDAAVKFSLSSFSGCSSSCTKDCLVSTMPCNCAIKVDNRFAYTVDGLLKEDFLEERISEARDQRKQVLQICKECPLQKAKNEKALEQCKGHVKRKAIKECWISCGCNRTCGNRLVQRGVHSKLQVFFTPNGKGWGVRTLEKLPQGTFVCEYTGEILTISELYQRMSEDKSTSPVVLDAFWGCEESLEDNKALCLDGTRYGNISRFLNHRCLDANLIEIPVLVETPDQHYYHLAFFTTRDVEAMEELTWDYGIDFDDDESLVKPFECLCGSRFCRNKKRSKKTKKVMNRG